MAGDGKRREFAIYTVDSFTNEAFAGNPAAVCLLDSDKVSIYINSVFFATTTTQ